MPAKSGTFFKFWDTDIGQFKEVKVCPLPQQRDLLGMYDDGRIYLSNMRDLKTFFHEASHHVVTIHMPQLYTTPRGRAVEEMVADVAAAVAVKRVPVPSGAGWRLIEMGLRLKSCRMLKFDGDGDPYLASKCILAALKAKPKLILSLFP